MREARKRSILKALTWRAIATSTTMVLAYAATGDMKVAGAIGAADVVIKLFFLLHPRTRLGPNSVGEKRAFWRGINLLDSLYQLYYNVCSSSTQT